MGLASHKIDQQSSYSPREVLDASQSIDTRGPQIKLRSCWEFGTRVTRRGADDKTGNQAMHVVVVVVVLMATICREDLPERRTDGYREWRDPQTDGPTYIASTWHVHGGERVGPAAPCATHCSSCQKIESCMQGVLIRPGQSQQLTVRALCAQCCSPVSR